MLYMLLYSSMQHSPCLHRASMTFKHFIIQLIHQNIFRRYIKNYKIFKIALTCFGSQVIHHQGALYSSWLKLQKSFSRFH